MSILDDFKARFPEIDPAKADVLVPIYENIYSCYYGGDYAVACDKEAILLLLAHLVVTDPQYTGGSGSAPSRSTQSKTVGSVSVSYDAVESGSNQTVWFNSTRYGQMFLMVTANNIGPKFA